MLASQASIASTPEASVVSITRIAVQNSLGPATAIPIATQVAAIARVTTGPAIATLNSVPGESVSPFIRATPPNSHSVIEVIGIPLRTATTACPSSCRRIEAKKRSAEATASRYASVSECRGPRTSW